MSSLTEFTSLPMIEYFLSTLNQLCASTTTVTEESFNQFRNNINTYYAKCGNLSNNNDQLSKENWLIWLNYVGRISPHACTDDYSIPPNPPVLNLVPSPANEG